MQRLFLLLLIASLAAPLGWGQAPGVPAAPEGDAFAIFEEGWAWTKEVLRLRVGENRFGRVLGSFGVLLAAIFIRKTVVVFIFARARRILQKFKVGERNFFGVLEGPVSGFILILGIFLSLSLLRLDPAIELLALRGFQASILVVVFWGFLRIVDLVSDILFDIAREKQLAIFPFVPLLKKTIRVFFVIIGAILIVQNLGYSVGSLLAGLGIGGLAVALAAQDPLSNLFGSLIVAVDRPFKIGDFVKVGHTEGVIEEIGLRSTKIRTRAKSLTTIPNKLMASEVIDNFSEIVKRRVEQTVGVTYETRPDQMEALLEAIRAILAKDDGVDKELQLVRFANFGASSLDIFIVYFTTTPSWADHFTTRERINLKILRTVAELGLSIAFPTQTIHFAGQTPEGLAPRFQRPEALLQKES